MQAEYWTTDLIELPKFWAVLRTDLHKHFSAARLKWEFDIKYYLVYVNTSLLLLFSVFSGSEGMRIEKGNPKKKIRRCWEGVYEAKLNKGIDLNRVLHGQGRSLWKCDQSCVI